MGITVAQSQSAIAQGRLAPLAVVAGAAASIGASGVSRLPPLASTGVGSQGVQVSARGSLALSVGAHVAASQAASALASLGALATVIQVQALNVNTARIVATLPRLVAAGAVAASQQAAAIATLGAITSAIEVQAINVNAARIVASLPRLRASSHASATGSAHAVGRLTPATAGTTAASQAAHASASLRLRAVVALATHASAYIDATLGPLDTSITVQPPPAGYAADGGYYVALAARPFYASLDLRPFYAAARARSFYVLSNPDMTPNFDTMDPRETQVLTFDATADLASGETLTEIKQITATLQFGVGGSVLPTLTGQVINGTPVTVEVNGKAITIATACAVQVIASGGVSGCGYLISVTCATSNPDKVLVLKGVLPVSAN